MMREKLRNIIEFVKLYVSAFGSSKLKILVYLLGMLKYGYKLLKGTRHGDND